MVYLINNKRNLELKIFLINKFINLDNCIDKQKKMRVFLFLIILIKDKFFKCI